MGLRVGVRYRTTRQVAAEWGCTHTELSRWCAQGRVPGAERLGRQWRIPEGAELLAEQPRARASQQIDRAFALLLGEG